MTDRSPEIRPVEPTEAALFVELRREALAAAPLAFGASPEMDRGLSADFMRDSLSDPATAAVIGAFVDGALVGVTGVGRLSGEKQQHRAIIWGMYVAPPGRGRGLGRALLDAAIQQARSWRGVERIQLSVTDEAAEARRLYESAGFREWGVNRRALRHEGRFTDEHHLVLDLTTDE